jgi:hypothetical protein
VQVIRVGGTVEVAAAVAGVSERTFYAWMVRGDPSRTSKRDAPHRAFRAAVERARAERQATLVAVLTQSAHKGSWRAAAWLLEREFPEQWAGDRASSGALTGRPPDDEDVIVDDQLGADGKPL